MRAGGSRRLPRRSQGNACAGSISVRPRPTLPVSTRSRPQLLRNFSGTPLVVYEEAALLTAEVPDPRVVAAAWGPPLPQLGPERTPIRSAPIFRGQVRHARGRADGARAPPHTSGTLSPCLFAVDCSPRVCEPLPFQQLPVYGTGASLSADRSSRFFNRNGAMWAIRAAGRRVQCTGNIRHHGLDVNAVPGDV